MYIVHVGGPYQMFLTADCHQRALKIFQANPSSPVLDLSHLSLRPLHISPLFTSLQGHTNLTSLNLSGNRLKNDAMTLLANTLARHASLHVLDLSCTGITAQVCILDEETVLSTVVICISLVGENVFDCLYHCGLFPTAGC